MNSYLIFPDSIQFDENMVAIFKDGRQKGISQTAPEVHQLILDTWDIMLTKNHCWIYSANWYRNMVWLMDYRPFSGLCMLVHAIHHRWRHTAAPISASWEWCSVPVVVYITLPMLRLLSSKVQGRKVFWKPLNNVCHVGINWIALSLSLWLLSDEYPCARISVIFQDFWHGRQHRG